MKKTVAAVVVSCMILFLPAPWKAGAVVSTPEGVKTASPSWEDRYVKEARITIEKGVMSVMNGLRTPEQLQESVNYFCRTWNDHWADSQLFILQDERDIDVYGNLYSLKVLCRTLRLAANDWHAVERSSRSEETLEKALWLEKQSELLASYRGRATATICRGAWPLCRNSSRMWMNFINFTPFAPCCAERGRTRETAV